MSSNTSFEIRSPSPERKYRVLLAALAKKLLGLNESAIRIVSPIEPNYLLELKQVKIEFHDPNDFSLKLLNCSNNKPATIPSYCVRLVLNAPREIDAQLQEVLKSLQVPKLYAHSHYGKSTSEKDPLALEQLFGNDYDAILANERFDQLVKSIEALKPALENDIKPKLIKNTTLVKQEIAIRKREAQRARNLKLGMITVGGFAASYLVFKLISK